VKVEQQIEHDNAEQDVSWALHEMGILAINCDDHELKYDDEGANY
jgi:hypothetical protein